MTRLAFRPGSAGARSSPAFSRAQARSWWLATLEAARAAACDPAFDGPEARRLEAFRHRVGGAAPCALPVDGVSATLIGEAFVCCARALAEAGTPARRLTVAQAVLALAQAIETLLHEAALEGAQAWQRQWRD